MESQKRKTTTSNEVKYRYNAKTYAQYNIKLRKDTDVDIIALIEAEKAAGATTSEAIKNLIRR